MLVVDHSAYRFRVDSRYLFVSRKNSTGNRKQDEKSRRLYVTDDYGSEKVKFKEVRLPSLQDEQVCWGQGENNCSLMINLLFTQFYVVMATHESGAFIHVYQANG